MVHATAAVGLAATLLAACTGTIAPDRASDEMPSRPPAAPGTPTPAPVPSSASAACAPSAAPGGTRLIRLSHLQYRNTLRDLLNVEAKTAESFVADPTIDGFTNNADELFVSDTLSRAYRAAAEEVAATVAADPGGIARVAGCAAADAACPAAFVAAFGQRAFRRPLTPDEAKAYGAHFTAAAALYATGTAFERGVRGVVEAMLQSPHFLYRTELRDRAVDGARMLDDFDVAARLAYALWNTMPDGALFAAASAGKLRTGAEIAAQVRRMLDDPRAREGVAAFHAEWLATATYEEIQRDAKSFPAWNAALVPAMEEEVRRFAVSVYDDGKGLPELLTAPHTFADGRLARVYGVTGIAGDTFVRTALDPKQRRGLLTQPGFLAVNAHLDASSPIKRSVFIHKRVLCTNIPSPPGDVDVGTPPALGGAIRTTRDQVTEQTKGGVCGACHHTLINPLGFAFEHYDALGQFRTADNGAPVDASGRLVIGSGALEFTDAVDLVQKLPATPEARACYAVHWLRYQYGRRDAEADACTLGAIADRLARPDYAVKELLFDLATAPPFVLRAP